MKLALLILSVATLAACVSTAPVEPVPTPVEIVLSPEENALANVPASALGPQDLLPGECGLFLWSKTDTTKFIFFTKAVSGTALISQGDSPMTLTQTQAGGNLFGQFNTHYSYLSEAGDQIDLLITPGEMLEGGQRVDSGLITTVGEGGWQVKLPVLGVQACQPE